MVDFLKYEDELVVTLKKQFSHSTVYCNESCVNIELFRPP